MIFDTLPITCYYSETQCRATPDGGLLYIGGRSITYIGPVVSPNEAPKIKLFYTRQFTKCIDLDPAWGKSVVSSLAVNKQHSGKFFAIVAEDKTVQIWDFELERAICGHNVHVSSQRHGEGCHQRKNSPGVHISYMSNSNVLSVDDHDLVIYCVASNSYCKRPLFVSTRSQQITALHCSPYNQNICAIGTSRGLVLVCDVQNMKIIYTLRGHNCPVTSFAWNRFKVNKPVNIIPTSSKDTENEAKPEKSKAHSNDDDLFDIYNFDYLESEFGAPVRRRLKSKSSDDAGDFVGIEKPAEIITNTEIDFIEACENMKAEINAFHVEIVAEETGVSLDRTKNEVTLADCQKRKLTKDENLSITGSSRQGNSLGARSDSSEGSLELLHYTSSDDAIVVDGAERKPKHEVLHHIYHQAEVHTAAVTSSDLLTNKAMVKTTLKEDKSRSTSSLEVTDLCQAKNINDNYDILLISIANDSSVWLWNSQTGGICENINKRGFGKNCTMFASIAWLDDHNVLIIDRHFHLSIWKLHHDTKLNQFCFVEELVRKSQFDNVCAFAVCPGSQKVWAILKTRKVMLVNMETDQINAEYGFVSLNTKSITECPDDMNKIALGFSDKRVGILDISKLTPENVSIENFLGVSSMILSLVWSPDSTKLAYGTIDGKVGVFNVETGKHAVEFKPLFSREIYSLAWHNSQIFFVCNWTVGIYDMNNPKSDAFVLKNVAKVTTLTVRDNFLLVGTQDGELQLFRHKNSNPLRYECVQILVLMPRYITMIVWNPLKEDTLAVVGNDNHIIVLRFKAEQSLLEITKKLVYSQNCLITWVKWSNFNENLLLFCTRKGSVVVWNLLHPEKELLDKEFPCPIFAAIFLPSDENIVMCCGSAISLAFFDINKELKKDPKEKNLTNALHKVQWATKSSAFIEPQTLSAAEKKKIRRAANREAKRLNEKKNVNKIEDKTILNEIGKDVEVMKRADIDSNLVIANENRDQQKDIADLMHNLSINSLHSSQKSVNNEKKTTPGFMTHSSTLLYLTGKELNKHALDKLQIVLAGDATKIQESVLCAKLFGTNAAAKELLNLELNNQKSTDTKSIASIFLTQINLTLKEEILQCIKNKTLCEWHVSLAPTIDYNFWQQCCTAFADQLIEQGYVLQGATYMMAAHNKYDAIQILLKKMYFREALLFARVYLPMTNPIQDKIVKKWIEHLDNNGNVMGAALICVLANDLLRGYQLLSKIRTPTPQITELLELIKQNGELHLLLGEKAPDISECSETLTTSDVTT